MEPIFSGKFFRITAEERFFDYETYGESLWETIGAIPPHDRREFLDP